MAPGTAASGGIDPEISAVTHPRLLRAAGMIVGVYMCVCLSGRALHRAAPTDKWAPSIWFGAGAASSLCRARPLARAVATLGRDGPMRA